MTNLTRQRDYRADEFLSSSDVNEFVTRAIRTQEARPAARILNVDSEGQEIGSGSWSPLEASAALFDNRMWDESSGLVIPHEGLYLFGLNQAVFTSTAGIRLGRVVLNDQKTIARSGPMVPSGIRFRGLTHGTWYGYEDDRAVAEMYQTSGAGLAVLNEEQYGTHFWGVRLTAGRSVETWNNPATWASSDKPTDTQLRQQIMENFRWLRSRPAARVSRASGTQSLTNNAYTAMTFDMPLVDSTASKMFASATSTRVTCQRTGIYLVGGSCHIAANVTGQTGLRVRWHNSADSSQAVICQSHGLPGNAGHGGRHNVIGLISMTAGDFLTLEGFQNSGAGLNHVTHPEHAPVLWAVHVSDLATPPTVADPKTWARLDGLTHTDLNANLRDWLLFLFGPPAVKAVRNATQSIPNNTLTPIDWSGTDHIDNDAMHDHASGTVATRQQIVFNRSGLYLVMCNIPWATNGTGSRRIVRIIKGGDLTNGTIAWDHAFPGNASTDVHVCVPTLHRFSAGEFAEVYVEHNAGAALNVLANGTSSPLSFSAVRLAA